MPVFAEILTWNLLVAAGFAVVAGLMRGFAGFGSAMMMAPLFAILFGPVETVAIIILMELVVSVQLVPGARGHIQWRFVGTMCVVAALFMPLGTLVLVSVDPGLMSRVLAGIVLAFVLVLTAGWRYDGEKKLVPTVGVGALSGVLMAATSMGGPPVLLYMLSSRDTARTNRSNIIAYFALTEFILFAVMTVSGLITWAPVVRAAVLTPGFVLAAWVGSRLFRESSEAGYRRVALVFLLGVALYGLLR